MNILTPTADGSNTLFNETIGEHYHSAHGAVQESKHVFVNAGLDFFISEGHQTVHILEIGFGTGLNFLLTVAHAEEKKVHLNYTGIEAFPLPIGVIEQTGYNKYVNPTIWGKFTKHYQAASAETQTLSPSCQLLIEHTQLQDFASKEQYDVIYYDAFSVRHQPEMWTDAIIAKTCNFLKTGGIFVTYAITGNLKRALKNCGLTIEKLPGAPGKREMLRATKN